MKLILLFVISLVSVYGSEVSILSKTKENEVWNIHYKIKSQNNTFKSQIVYDNHELNTSDIKHPSPKLSNAVMFLIDASAPMKKEFNLGIKPTIKNIFSLKNDWDKWAISSFAEDVKVLGLYDEKFPQEALEKISVRGQRTELFRAALEAMKSLEKQNVARKFLFIFSDGEAEDNAYTYKEVIEKAKKSNITIISFGYKDSIHLQSLRRISEESGGKLFIADKSTSQLEYGYLTNLEHVFSEDAIISFNSSVLKATKTGKTELKLVVKFMDGASVSKKFTLEVLQEKTSYISLVIIGFLIISGILFFILRKRKDVEEIVEENTPIAYFKSASGDKQYIYKKHNSIGALAENDVVIEGEYISRHHATLDLKDGKFYIVDNNSSNKVFVNYKEVLNSQVKDGDTIAFGPYEVTFKIL